MDYEYQLVCSKTANTLNQKVNEMVREGWRPMGPHTHQKAHHTDVVESQVWYNVFCISMEKKSYPNEGHRRASP